MKRQVKVEMVVNLDCSPKEYDVILNLLNHHMEELIDLDEFPEIESIHNVFIREEKGLMAKEQPIEVEGIVSEVLPGTKFKVKLKDNETIVVNCGLSGKLRQNHIKILKGDEVTIEMSPYDLTNGRITWRSK